MFNNIRSSLYKLSKDWTFRIVLIIGVVLAIFINLVYLFIDIDLSKGESVLVHLNSNGQNALLGSFSPLQNFGITVPINLCVYIVAEFTNGTIRNKIIAGHKKSSIYLSLFVIGLIFTISLMAIYALLSFAIGSIMGGFDPNGRLTNGMCSPELLVQTCVYSLCLYIFMVALCVFIVTIFRSVGPALGIVMTGTVVLFFMGMGEGITNGIGSLSGKTPVMGYAGWLNPLYTCGMHSIYKFKLDNTWFLASIVTPLYWTVILVFLGTLIFKKRDIK